MSTFFSDIRFALRQLRKTPGMAFLAILTLALGVGANLAIFTVIQSVLLRPLPYPNSNRMVVIEPPFEKPGLVATSWLNYQDVRKGVNALEQAAAYSEDIAVVKTPSGSSSVAAPHLTPELFKLVDAHPILGRTFSAAEGQANGPDVVILSEDLWRNNFHADPNIIGKPIKIGGTGHVVVGVMPRSFRFPESMGADIRTAVWLPLQPTEQMLTARGLSFIYIIGVLRPFATSHEVRSELDAVAARIGPRVSEPHPRFESHSYQELLTGPVKPVLYGLLGALGLVLLIACANVSNLLIARCLVRRQEYAVRMAIGAGRVHLIRQMLTEGLLLSLAGCAAGLALAYAALQAVQYLPADTIPRAESIGIQWPVLLVLIAVAIFTTVLSSLLPGLLVSRANPQDALQSASRGLGSRSLSSRLSGFLVAGEVALSALLLVGTGLLFHTLWNLERVRLGFDVDRLTTFNATPADTAGFFGAAISPEKGAVVSVDKLVYQPVLDGIRAIPGVESATIATAPPFSGVDFHVTPAIVGEPKGPELPRARISAIAGDYARTMRTPLEEGRMITDADTESAPFVCVVNEAFVHKYMAHKNPLGRQLDLGGKDTGMLKPCTIVGVLSDQVDDRVGVAQQPALLLPLAQIPTQSMFYPALLQTMVTFIVRTRGDVPVASDARTVVHKLAPDYALDSFQTMQDAVDKNTFSQRLGLYLVSSFAGLATIMVVAGLYGVLAQIVSYRQREIGIRMAVGATRQSVASLIIGQGSVLICVGLIAGLLLSAAVGRLVTGFLYNVQPLDTWTYVGSATAMAIVGLLASALPARRAASLEPLDALREE